jgi:dynactin complex subunit
VELGKVASNHAGVIAYLGSTHFADGTWVGVELGKVASNHAGVIGYLGYLHTLMMVPG